MSIDIAHYHGWRGSLRSPWLASLAIVRVALMQVFRRKAYWLVLALGLGHFLFDWIWIYGITQAGQVPEIRGAMLEQIGFDAAPKNGLQTGYLAFMERQSVAVMILLAFSGSLLVGSDFRLNALPFYLSRRIDRRHYIAGKLLAVGVIVSLLTTVPALLLYFEYGMFSPSLRYWIDNWRAVVAILLYGAVLAAALSILLVSLSAYLQRMAPIAITWSSLFVLPKPLRQLLVKETHNDYWNLIDPWRDIHYAGRWRFGGLRPSEDDRLAPWAAAVLAVACTIAVLALVRRVRAVEVVE
ncbi:MAG TPA: hypothetical protein VGN42_14425 [Pirellulales bacterium]|jgi:hypothetical protein|nr:hypothetical protein [Pirellulales bacterium]